MRYERRVQEDGERKYFSLEWTEVTGDFIWGTHPSRRDAISVAQEEATHIGWAIWQMWHDNDTIVMESRSDRNHLCITVISPTKEKAKLELRKAMEVLW